MSQPNSDKPRVLPVAVPLFRDLFVITDPGRDQDDEDVLTMLNRMIRLEILRVMGVIANLAPSSMRARLAKGTLKQLGQPDIAVGIGSACQQTDDDGLDYQFAVSYLAEHDSVVDGKELIYNTLKQARPKSIVLLLISGLTDAAAVLREHHYLFNMAVRRVVIMGGVEVEGDRPKLDAEGRMLPDMTAQNHSFDKEATAFLYKQLQDMNIPITVFTRHAAAAAKVPRSIYDEMAATGHPVGIRLLAAQKKAIEEVWHRACLPADDSARQGLPARCDRNWFLNAFCGGQGQDRKPEDSIWDLIQTFMLYDPCTLVACLPDLREHFYASCVVEVHGVEHMVIGVNPKVHNVRAPEELAAFLKNMMVESLNQSLQAAEEEAAAARKVA
ncbi:MAG TPA: nucleoside hydrolase [Candidatus Obscuribacter sp.]|nr:nucleoside hydrolase [Candidatus Obscuribacter sp.]HND05394.1 nucleoside hydrolase [Candidatus Obscuribacter sp.]